MKKDTNKLLEELPALFAASPSLSRVTKWVQQGRRRKRFHALVWLSRVWRRYGN